MTLLVYVATPFSHVIIDSSQFSATDGCLLGIRVIFTCSPSQASPFPTNLEYSPGSVCAHNIPLLSL